MRTEIIQVSTTVDSEVAANRIALKLLGERVAACVQVFGPIKSSYWWNGRIERLREWYCLVKGRAKDYRLIENSIKKVHPYKVPEILAIPANRVNQEYLRWMIAETTRKPRHQARSASTVRN